MQQPQRILIVEDEQRLAALVADYLKAAGYQVDQLYTGETVLDWVRTHRPDLILLDLMLPGKDGLTLCREIRAAPGEPGRLPVIMTTARVEEIDRLIGLELGADDYVCKPYSPRELVARVKAVLRRSAGPPVSDALGAEAAAGAVAVDPLILDPDALRVQAQGRAIELTAVEFALLATLHAAPGRIFSRERLMDRIYTDRRIVADRTIDSHIKKLRRRLDELLPGRELVHSVYGVGYRYEDRGVE
jgi:two-component system, OmpR family, response regulator BaeR